MTNNFKKCDHLSPRKNQTAFSKHTKIFRSSGQFSENSKIFKKKTKTLKNEANNKNHGRGRIDEIDTQTQST